MKNFKFNPVLFFLSIIALSLFACKEDEGIKPVDTNPVTEKPVANPAMEKLVGRYTVNDYYTDMQSYDTTSYEMTITKSGDNTVTVANFLNTGKTVNGSIIVYKGGATDLYQLTIPSQEVGTKFHSINNPVINGVGPYDGLKLSLTYIVDSKTTAQKGTGTAVAIRKTQ